MKHIITKTLRGIIDKLESKSIEVTTTTSDIKTVCTLYGLGQSKGIGWMSCLGAINYYCKVSPIANAVDLIASKVAEVYLSIWDKKEKVYLQDVDGGTPYNVLDLLKICDLNKTYSEYMVAQASYYLITGNAFFISQFMENGEPLNVLIAKPQDITIIGSSTSIASSYIWTDGSRNIVFKLDQTTFRYIGEDKNGFKYELKHVKMFNPKYSEGNLWGMSKLTQIYLEMEQHLSGAMHNNNLLSTGARPSGVLTLDEEMSDEAYEKARSEVNKFYSGAENAGNILIFEGQGSRFEPFNISPRDMDFATLSEKNVIAIYNRLNIPLPFISTDTMTYDNLSEALYQLYILAVLPIVETFLEALTDLLMYRYKDGERYEIHYDEMDIDVMSDRKRAQDAETVRLGITTYNEARSMFKLDDVATGGDEILINSGLVPLSQVAEQSSIELDKLKKEAEKADKEEEKPQIQYVMPPVENNQEDNQENDQKDDKEDVEIVDKETAKSILKKQNFTEQEIEEALKSIYE